MKYRFNLGSLRNVTQRIEAGMIWRSKNLVDAFFTVLFAIFAFKYSEDKIYLVVSGSFSATSGVIGLAGRIFKEQFLKPHEEALRTNSSSYNLNSRSSTIATSEATNSSSSYRTAQEI
ncbi:35461_t:CDS:2 [Racocetra persica]|uniref:35461_t:CDS:1 n=2 Tax=Racocetra persica TaxID=160502 RepID=A0ACA9KJP6_9GLOM|nr:35460_t:CDS:2 [Racocetra persica]CAG8476552.1 35461_t:CDS:2 [Racocetra persica]